MKEKINEKINEIIEHILSKKPEDITYNEYRILDSKYACLKWDEEQAGRRQKMSELFASALENPFGSPLPACSLPDPVPDDKKGE